MCSVSVMYEISKGCNSYSSITEFVRVVFSCV